MQRLEKNEKKMRKKLDTYQIKSYTIVEFFNYLHKTL